jgi:hypothetical protein
MNVPRLYRGNTTTFLSTHVRGTWSSTTPTVAIAASATEFVTGAAELV